MNSEFTQKTSWHPQLIVDPVIAKRNIRFMKNKADVAGTDLRPHFKTHQSRAIGNWFRDAGINGITVSSVRMARYFAEDGWNDITLAFPLNVLAASEYDRLSKDIRLSVLVSSAEVVRMMDTELNHETGLYIELDPEYGRSGMPVQNAAAIAELHETIQHSAHFRFAGFYCHAGHSYHCRSEEEIINLSDGVLNKLRIIRESWPDAPICFGDTPSCSVRDNFDPATQLSPGNFVFYDWMQTRIGSCTPDDIALYLRCPVIETYPERQQVLIHGGAVHFSKESSEYNGTVQFGVVKSNNPDYTGQVVKISQEHGLVQCSSELFKSLSPGSTLDIYPVHSCLTADEMGAYFTESGEYLDHAEAKAFQ